MIKITTPETRFPPADRCIYCGNTDGKLTDEHVLSHGLAGDSLILRKASCAICQAATSKVETVCLRHLWWPFRTQTGVPMRDTPPQEFSLKRMRVDSYDRENDEIKKYTQLSMDDIPVDDYPIFYQTFEFPPPGVTAQREASADVEYSFWCKIDDASFQKLKLGDQEGFRIGPGRPEAFCRLLAKTAHAYAVAQFGSQSFEPSLSDYIRGKQLDRLQWIGCTEVQVASDALYELSSLVVDIEGTDYLAIDVRLFACINAPEYRVIVGKLLASADVIAANPAFRVEFEGKMPLQASDVLRGRAEGWAS
jgi:hypothetical protein